MTLRVSKFTLHLDGYEAAEAEYAAWTLLDDGWGRLALNGERWVVHETPAGAVARRGLAQREVWRDGWKPGERAGSALHLPIHRLVQRVNRHLEAA